MKKACVKGQMVSKDVRGSLKRCGTAVIFLVNFFFKLKPVNIYHFHCNEEVRESRQKYGFYLLFFLFLKTPVKKVLGHKSLVICPFRQMHLSTLLDLIHSQVVRVHTFAAPVTR